ncbi:protein DpdE [Devosia aquimaris]|uniref:protein DpdE n=1 Tax=Devosia aquimaris TaxID=2866214 RepID=UPI001CD08854|nr:protein DpdE [Devosia sp. CJK-A8-3]
MFVKAREGEHASFGVGKAISRRGDLCTVEFFDAPWNPAVSATIALDDLEAVSLPEQTRIYFYNASIGAWEIGRLLDDHGTRQYCKFPNGSERWLSVADVNVRWNRAILDPTAFLAGKVNETPRFSDGRSGFVRSVMAQRGLTMGMSALISSAVELEAHQIEVVRRILQDPVQRYLLADEVGLGKTIEAGILIRQCILDCGESAFILIVVPDALVSQWRHELDEKFFLNADFEGRLRVLGASDHEAICTLLDRATMLVIDEAHHLTGKSAGYERELYENIAVAAKKIDRVLLLSATPALHNERGFLEMLHLLDPDTYALDDEVGFRRRVRSRQMLAQIVAGLAPENVLYLDHTLNQLAEHFADDQLLQSHVAALRIVGDGLPDESDPELINAIGRVRSHISEVYRLHRRILRHRRSNIAGLTPDRSGAIRVEYDSSATARVCEAIEYWRFDEATTLDVESIRADRSRVFFQTLERMQEYACSGVGSIDRLAEKVALVSDTKRLDVILQELASEQALDDRASALVEAIKPLLGPRQQFVVFCTDRETADRLVKTLAAVLELPIDRHDPEHEDWMAFNRDQTRPILVCDRRAEEGLNLQGGRKIVIHYDLPFNPNRIEQRLGRADRYGSGEPVRSIILVCRDNPYEDAWARYLDNALKVFDRSVASLQYVIEEMTGTFASLLFREGSEALIDLLMESQGEDGRIEREIADIDQQDALDALGAPSSEMLDALTDLDDEWRKIDTAASAWIETNLMFTRVSGRTREEQTSGALPFCYRYMTHQPHTLVPLETYLNRFSAAIDNSLQARLARTVRTYPMTYRRRTALGREGRAMHARLLRYGEPFIDGMWDLSQIDDRGRSTALWRFFPGHQGEGAVDLYFRFDFIVEPDLARARDVLAAADRLSEASEAAIRRRGDMALPPFFRTVWLDQEMELVTDPDLLTKLDLPYRPTAIGRGGRDFNLNPMRWNQLGLLRLPQMTDWPAICWQARRQAELALRQSSAFVGGLVAARNRSAEVDFGRLGQLRARADRRSDPTAEKEWQIERDLADALSAGINAPSIRVDAALACFLTGDHAMTATVDGAG